LQLPAAAEAFGAFTDGLTGTPDCCEKQ